MKIERIFLYISVVLFAISLFLPVQHRDITGYGNLGWAYLLVGLAAVLYGQLGWLANVFGIFAFYYACIKKYDFGAILALTSLGFIIAFCLYIGNYNWANWEIGFYVWTSSFAVLLIACLIGLLKAKNINH